MNINCNNDTLDKIYENKQERLGIIPENIKEKLYNVQLEKIKKDIVINSNDEEKIKLIIKEIENLTEDYEIKMAYLMENSYKSGFKDAFKLFLNCIKE